MTKSNNISVLFVDDEQAALQGITDKVLKLFPDFKVIGSFQNPKKAIDTINTEKPDLLFLDIEMPHYNGFELLKQLPNLTAEVIFVTAYNTYGIEALKANAVDYILKPIDNTELKLAIQKAIGAIAQRNNGDINTKLTKLLKYTLAKSDKLIIPTTNGMSFVKQTEIIHIEGYEGYTKIHLRDGNIITSSYNLGKYFPLLGEMFFKCHKSHIVNLDYVIGFENEGYLLFTDDKRVPISRTNRKVILDIIS